MAPEPVLSVTHVGGMRVFGLRCGTVQRSAVAARKWPVPSVSPARASSKYAVVGAGPRGCRRPVIREWRPPPGMRTATCGASVLKGRGQAGSLASRGQGAGSHRSGWASLLHRQRLIEEHRVPELAERPNAGGRLVTERRGLAEGGCLRRKHPPSRLSPSGAYDVSTRGTHIMSSLISFSTCSAVRRLRSSCANACSSSSESAMARADCFSAASDA